MHATKTLRIKKVYFDAIAKGDKSIEYRADKPYYQWLRDVKPPFYLKLHYQQKGIYLIKTVKKVKRIKTPKSISSDYVPTDYCWSIHF